MLVDRDPVVGRMVRSIGNNREQLVAVDRPCGRSFLCHGRPGGWPGRACAHCAHRSTGRLTGPISWPVISSVLTPFGFRSLRYFPDEFKKLFRCIFISFISSLTTILHLGEDFPNLNRTPMNIWRNRHTISVKLTHDLGLSTPKEIGTQSRWNWHDLNEIDTRSRFGQQKKPIPSKRIASTHTIHFQWSHRIHIEFFIPSSNALQTLISIARFQPQLNYPNGMQHTCLPNT